VRGSVLTYWWSPNRVGGREWLRCRWVLGSVLTYWWSLNRVGGREWLRCRWVRGSVLTYWWSPNRVGGRAGPSLVRRGRGNADPMYLGQNPLSNHCMSSMVSKS
jgi:hypothetical protein